MKRIESYVRWEGNNLLAIRDFLAKLDFAALIEPVGTKAHIVLIVGTNSNFEITLNDGDGLLWDGEILGTARNIVLSGEMPRPEAIQ